MSKSVSTTGQADPAPRLGVKISGSGKAHQIELAREDALEAIFGTDDPGQARALLSHCLKVLKRDEASDEHPANDERTGKLSSATSSTGGRGHDRGWREPHAQGPCGP